jgi:rubrerythrin
MGGNDIINGCIKVEKSAAAIYSNLMQKFPDKKEFWKELLDNEIEHISFLNDTLSHELTEELQKMDIPPSLNVINRTQKLADSIHEKVKQGAVSLKDSLEMMLKLEETMVETYTNSLIAELMSCEDDACYERVMSDEKTHVEKIRDMIKTL